MDVSAKSLILYLSCVPGQCGQHKEKSSDSCPEPPASSTDVNEDEASKGGNDEPMVRHFIGKT